MNQDKDLKIEVRRGKGGGGKRFFLKQGWAASANLREQSSVFRVVAHFLYFFLLNNMKDWCFLNICFRRSSHSLLRFKGIRCI